MKKNGKGMKKIINVFVMFGIINILNGEKVFAVNNVQSKEETVYIWLLVLIAIGLIVGKYFFDKDMK